MGRSNPTNLTLPQPPTGGEFTLGGQTYTQDFSSPVKFGGDIWNLNTSGSGNLSATNTATGETISTQNSTKKDWGQILDKGLSSFKPSFSEYQYSRFTPYSEQGGLPITPSPSTIPYVKSNPWASIEDTRTIEQFLNWQKRMGY